MTADQGVPAPASKQVKDETNLMQENLSSVVAEEPKAVKKEETKQKQEEKKSTEMNEVKVPESEIEEVDMSGMLSSETRSKWNRGLR